MKRAFTLVEVLIASAISTIVLIAVFSSFITTKCMLMNAMTESELSLAARELREKLLFQVSPYDGGVHFGGLLSGTNSNSVVESGTAAISMFSGAVGTSLSDIHPQTIRLVLSSDGASGSQGIGETWCYLFNDGAPNKDSHKNWLWPSRLSLDETSLDDVVTVYRSSSSAPPYALSFLINLKSNMANPDGTRATYQERVYVPLFGKIQPQGD